MIVQGQTGYVVGADGSRNNLRQGRTGELIIGQAHADYNEPTSRGSVFNVTMNAAVPTLQHNLQFGIQWVLVLT